MPLEYTQGFTETTLWHPMADNDRLALVLEDTELGRWALTRSLEAEGFEVRAVATWPEASAWLQGAKFSLALVAVSSAPGEVAHMAAAIRRGYPDTRLVLLADPDSVHELRLACGPGPDILEKPFDLEEVARVALSRPGSAGHSGRG